VIQVGSNSPVIYYLCKDHLGSITGIMDSNGNMLEELNYDPWGKRRNPQDWSYTNVTAPTYTERGFTGHEHLDSFGLINMNGRIFDPEISRFLSPDPIVQNPYNLLNYNRYSYCLNNPLKFTDPSGYDYQKIMEDYYRDQQNAIPPTEFFNNYPGGWGNNIAHKASNFYKNYQLYQEAKLNGYKGNFDQFQSELYKQIQVPLSAGSQRTFTWHTWSGGWRIENGNIFIVRGDRIDHSITLESDVEPSGGKGSEESQWVEALGVAGYISHGMIGSAASLNAKETYKFGQRMLNGTVKSAAQLTAENAEVMEGIAKGFNIAGGTIGAGVNTYKAINEYSYGETGWATFHGSVALSYAVGIALTIVCPECGYGEYLLISTMAADIAGDGVKSNNGH